uniref:Uncharacterized protein n=1 Tax=Arundo donax TaxID=35708 RepID=A0A0A9HF40_ARUDO
MDIFPDMSLTIFRYSPKKNLSLQNSFICIPDKYMQLITSSVSCSKLTRDLSFIII